MNRTRTTNRGNCAPVREGLSLLEVMIATGILAASSVMLLGLLSTGERHARQAERRVLGQMLCQSKLDEALAVPGGQINGDREPIAGYPDWECSVKETPTEMPGLVRLDVSVTRIEQGRATDRLEPSRERTAFELVRLVRKPAKSPASAGETIPASDAENPLPLAPSP